MEGAPLLANRDQVNERYYGQINSEESHEATRNRIHWICRHVQAIRCWMLGAVRA